MCVAILHWCAAHVSIVRGIGAVHCTAMVRSTAAWRLQTRRCLACTAAESPRACLAEACSRCPPRCSTCFSPPLTAAPAFRPAACSLKSARTPSSTKTLHSVFAFRSSGNAASAYAGKRQHMSTTSLPLDGTEASQTCSKIWPRASRSSSSLWSLASHGKAVLCIRV